MELKEFVKEVLVQLCEGVSDAQVEVSKLGGVVNPSGFRDDVKTEDKRRPVEIVHFEIGLVSENKEGSSKGIGVFLSAIGIGGKSTDEERLESVTRIKFSVPIALPAVDGNNTVTKGYCHVENAINTAFQS